MMDARALAKRRQGRTREGNLSAVVITVAATAVIAVIGWMVKTVLSGAFDKVGAVITSLQGVGS